MVTFQHQAAAIPRKSCKRCLRLSVLFGVVLIAAFARTVTAKEFAPAVLVEQCFAETTDIEEMFYVTAVDGVPVEPGCVGHVAPGSGSVGLTPITFSRHLTPHPQRVTLVATHRVRPEEAKGSRSAKTVWSVKGDVNFDPAPGGE